MIVTIIAAILCAFLRLVNAAIDPANLEFAYFVTSSFASNADDVFKDQSINHHDLRPYEGNKYPEYNAQDKYVDFSSHPNDGVGAASMANWQWPKEWGVSLWFRRDSAKENPLTETDQFILGNMNSKHVGSFDVYIRSPKSTGNATMGFAWTTQENSTTPARRQKFTGLLCPEREWHNFVLTGNGAYVNAWLDNGRVYFDIDHTYDQVAFGNLTSSPLPINVGGGQDGILPFQGEIKNVVFYNQHLGMLDVNELYFSSSISTYAPTWAPSTDPTGAPTKAPTFGKDYVIASYFTEESFDPPEPPKYPTALDMLYRETSNNTRVGSISATVDTSTGAIHPPISQNKVHTFTVYQFVCALLYFLLGLC